VTAPAAESPLLEVRDLQVAYGHVQAVRGVSLRVAEGRMVTLIGPNGAGKTSILSALAGLVRPAGGTVLLDGRDLTGLPAHRTVAAGLALVPEGRAILGRMTIEENLLLAGEGRQPRRVLAGALEEQYRRFPVLGERRREPAGALSGGQQQMLAVARALLMRPRVLLLDEPSMGLSPILVRQVFALIQRLHREGATILLVEQNARLALSISDDAYVLEHGRLVLQAPAAELARDPRVQAAYLGGSDGPHVDT
jgi:branched-chain amino acid transport system ATP-binding protein